MNSLNVCFVGLGSIAKRHITNLSTIAKRLEIDITIDCFRSSVRELPQEIASLINHVYYDLTAVPSGYDVIFITGPTNKHLDAIKQFQDKGTHFFIEKPLCDIKQDGSEIASIAAAEDRVFYVACPLRYTNVIQYLKENIDFSAAYSVRCISSSYLPDWRPGTDYRNTYSAHRDMGGGVSIDLIHEWDYLCYLLGKPSSVQSMIKKVSHLDIDTDDIAIYIADYGDKLVELHLDYFGRKTIRQIEIFCHDDTIIGDLTESKITYRNSGKVIDLSEQRNDFQMRELEYFIKMIQGEVPNTNDIRTALEVLNLTGGKVD